VTLSFHMLAVALGPADRLDGRTLDVALLMTEWHRAYGRVSKSQGILDRLLNLPNAAFVSVESACLAQ
jgi:hypothetical protein